MENPDGRFSELVDLVKSWIPRKTESPNVSRDFWMPDQSCRVCYECDSQFTIFNRRHHCRSCGRVFCAKCTSNSIHVSPDDPKYSREEGDRIRVCNYCFQQWEKEIVSADNGTLEASSSGLSPSPSAASLASSKCSDHSSGTIVSMPQSKGSYQRASHGSGYISHQSIRTEIGADKQEMHLERNDDSIMNVVDSSPPQSEFFMNRNCDVDDDDYDEYTNHMESGRKHLQHVDVQHGPIVFHDMEHCYASPTLPTADYIHALSQGHIHTGIDRFDKPEQIPRITNHYSRSPDYENTSLLAPYRSEHQTEEDQRHDNEYDSASSIFRAESPDAEPVDFENNGLLWFPPDPEDEEDEREGLIFDEDDDDDDAVAEWGNSRCSSGLGNPERSARDRSSEEHKRAMKNIVDGHFRALVAQLLQVDNLSIGEESDKESWLEIVTSMSWEVASLLKPDTSKGGGMDPGGYVKVKCLASGCRSESMVVKGIVCKKNVAHRRMTSKIRNPQILLLGGALEYQRVANLLSSFDTLLQQEMDHLKMAVAKIDSHQPDILLVEKSVSRFAQDYLLAKDISLVLNVKRPLLERISRCTGAQIVPSIDNMSHPKLGTCETFHVDKFVEEHDSAVHSGKKMVKTLMFFEGCPKPLGCTVLLRGASSDELKKVKHVMQCGIFAAYHLALETSFLADEGAAIPELPLQTPITVALPDKPSSIERSISIIPGFVSGVKKPLHENDVRSIREQRPEPSPYTGCISSNDPIVSPSSCSRSDFSYESLPQKTSSRLINQNHVQIVDGFLSQHCPSAASFPGQLSETYHEYTHYFSERLADSGNHEEPSKPQNFSLNVEQMPKGQPQDIYFQCVNASDSGHIQVPESDMDEQQVGANHLQHPIDSLIDQENYLHDEHAPLKEEFPPSPSDHQSILVSLSTRCVWKGTVCSPARMLRIKYYSNFDKPLGRFLRDDLLDQGFECPSCQRPTEAHVHCYTHRQGSLTISVKKLPEFMLPGESEGKIWMWHRCLKCPRNNGFPPATRRIVMSDAAWGLSFGKFLELSFSNHAAASRVASCGHSLHRDCLRFYGFGRMVACFRYAPIDVHSVYLPPAKLEFDYQLQKWVEQEANEVLSNAEVFFAEVLNSLCVFSGKISSIGSSHDDTKVSELRRKIAKLEELLRKEKGEFEDLLQKALAKELQKGQPTADTLEINRLKRQFLFHSYVWDNRLFFLDSSLKNMSTSFSRISLAEDLSNFRNTAKENLSLMEKVNDTNSSLKEQDCLTGIDSVVLKAKEDEACANDFHPVYSQKDTPRELPTSLVTHVDAQEMEEESIILKDKVDLTSGMNIKDQIYPRETGIVVRRALSEGSFPIVASLSDTLDAAWTGENHLGVLLPRELETVSSDSAMLDLSEKATALKSDSEVQLGLSGEKVEPDGTEFVSTPSAKLDNGHGEDFESWFEAPNFYQANGSNSCANGARFDVLGELNPTYLPTFRDASNQGGARLLLPVGVNDTVVPVYDDEPTSAVAYALVSQDYHIQLVAEKENMRDGSDSFFSLPFSEAATSHPLQPSDEISVESFRSFGSSDDIASALSGSKIYSSLDPVAYTKAMHAKISFTDEGPLGKMKYTVICYYAKRFDALRQICCPIELDFVRSISRCRKWGAQGGKSNVFFAKTLDDRFIIKQVTKTELDSFIKFAPEYFKYLSEAIGTGSPTCLAKILGIYQVSAKNFKGGKDTKMDFMIMENLLYRRNLTRVYDLKGSSRARYNDDSSGKNTVLLDQNLIESMPTSPIFVGNKAKRLLERAVWNDTSLLASIDVMDYSLLVGVDDEKHELVVGIIDYMRQYTWDKHLESWVKTAMFGLPKEQLPTVISPKQYKKRFRKAMSTYFLMVPDQWSPPSIIPSGSQSSLCDDNSQHPTGE